MNIFNYKLNVFYLVFLCNFNKFFLNETPLHIAISRKNKQICELLINHPKDSIYKTLENTMK